MGYNNSLSVCNTQVTSRLSFTFIFELMSQLPNQNKQKQNLSKSQRKKQRRANAQKPENLLQDATKLMENTGIKRSLEDVVRAFKDNNAKILSAMRTLDDKYTRISRLSAAAASKMGIRSASQEAVLAEIHSRLQKMGIELPHATKRQLLELVCLDDWGSVLKAAIPYILEYGIPFIQSMWQKYKSNSQSGGDEGFIPEDWGGPLSKQIQAMRPGVNVEIPGVKSMFALSGAVDAVSTHTIKTVICPELYKHRFTTINTQRTGLGQITFEYALTTNSAGAFGFILYPYNITQASGSVITAYAVLYNDNTFNPIACIQTPSASTLAGPLNNVVSNLDEMRLVSFSVEVKPLAALTTTGNFLVAYNNRRVATNTTTSMGATYDQLRQFPYAATFNIRSDYRMVGVHGVQSEKDMLAASTYVLNTQQLFLVGTGLAATSTVARVIVTTVFEYIPTVTVYPLVVLDFPQPGVMTEQFESTMFARFPVLQNAELKHARTIATGLPDEPTSFNHLIDILSQLTSKISYVDRRPEAMIGMGQELELPQGSISYEIE